MRMSVVVSAVAAAVVALTLFDATPADAAMKGRSFSRSIQRAPSRAVQPRVNRSVGNKFTKSPSSFVKKGASTNVIKKGSSPNFSKKGPPGNFTKKGPSPSFAKKSTLGGGTLNLRRLPVHKAAAGNQFLKGRVGVPQHIKPKLTLTHAPGKKFHHNFSPFIQRHWKKAFFWVAVAGIGYVTIPELYYDRFYSCVSVDDPVWDDCSYILSSAALEEEDVVRVSMPASARYRYTAKAAPKPSDCPDCQWQSFVERKWNQSFAWVKLPEVGNITVPDAYYDRFYSYAGANPPNYPQACKVLQDAAAVTDERDAPRMSMPSDASYRYEAEEAPTQECKSCTLQPFVERKWNKEYVWVQVPQTGNVTVPEDAYDRFYGYASADPPNYPAACKVLVEAAAEDTVMTTALDTRRGDEDQ